MAATGQTVRITVSLPANGHVVIKRSDGIGYDIPSVQEFQDGFLKDPAGSEVTDLLVLIAVASLVSRGLFADGATCSTTLDLTQSTNVATIGA